MRHITHIAARMLLTACFIASTPLMLVPTAHATAACAAGSRISVYGGAVDPVTGGISNETPCLGVTWSTGETHNGWSLTNQCVDWGELDAMVVEADGTTSSSHTLDANTPTVSGQYVKTRLGIPQNPPTIYCCTDGDGICAHEDAVSDASCLTAFNTTEAAAAVTNITAVVGSQPETCQIDADVPIPGTTETNPDGVEAFYPDVDDIIICTRYLERAGTC